MAKYRVLVSGIVLRDQTTAWGNTEVEGDKILDIEDHLKRGYIEEAGSKKSKDATDDKKLTAAQQKAKDAADAKKSHDDLVDAYKEAFDGADPDGTLTDEEIQKAIDEKPLT